MPPELTDAELEAAIAASPVEPSTGGPAGALTDAELEAAIAASPVEKTFMEEARDVGSSIVDGAAALAQGVGQGVTLGMKAPLRAASAGLITAVDAATGRDTSFSRNYAAVESASQDIEAASPTAAVVGQVLGGVASGLATGGVVGVAAKIAPQTAARIAQAGTLGRIASSAVGEGIVEGAIQGVGTVVDKAIETGNWSGVASRMGMEALQGATIGGVFGGAVEGAKGLASVTRRAADFAADQFGRAKSSLAAKVGADLEQSRALVTAAEVDADAAARRMQALADADAPIGSADEVAASIDSRVQNFAPAPVPDVFDADEQLAAALSHDDLIVDATKGIKSDLDTILDVRSLMQAEGGRAAKQRLFAQLADAPEGPLGGAAGPARAYNPLRDDYVLNLVRDARSEATRILSDGGAVIHAQGGGSAALRRMQNLADAFETRVAGKLNAGAAGEAFNELDNLKLTVGKLNKSPDGTVRQFAEGYYEKLRVMLEDNRLWGEVADEQRVFNAAYSKEISATQGLGVDSFIADSGKKSAYNPWENAEVANDASVRGLLNELGSGVTTREEAFRNFVAATDGSLVARAQALKDPKLIERAKAAREAAERIRDRLDAVNRSRAALQAHTRAQVARGGMAGAVSEAAGTAAAWAINPALGAAKSGIDAAKGIRKQLLDAAQMERAQAFIAARKAASASREAAAEVAAKQVEQAQKRLVAAKEAFARDATAPSGWKMGKRVAGAAEGGARGVARKAEGLGGVVKAAKDANADKAAIAAAQRILDAADAEDDAAAQLQARALAATARFAGGQGTSQALLEQHERTREAIRGVLGAPPRSFNGKAPKRLVSPTQARRVLDAAMAASAPLQALEAMARGTASHETRRVLAMVHGDLLAEFQGELVASLEGKQLTDQQRRIASTKIGIAYDDPVWSATLAPAPPPTPPARGGRTYKPEQTAGSGDKVAGL